MTLTFGSMVEKLRKQKGLTRYELALRSGAREANLFTIERRNYPYVEYKTVRKVAHGLTGKVDNTPLTPSERSQLVAAAFNDRVVGRVEEFAVYYLWSLGQPMALKTLLDGLREMGYTEVDELDGGEPVDFDSFQLFDKIAQDRRFAPLRAEIASKMFVAIEVDLATNATRLVPAPLGLRLMREAGVVAPHVEARGSGEDRAAPRATVEFPLVRIPHQ